MADDIGKRADKFWLRMAEKFGKRWLEERGTIPNGEWRSLIERYTDYQIKLALDELPKWSHPPTHPEMSAHLRAYAARTDERHGSDWMHGRWRSFVAGELSHWGWLKGFWAKGTSINGLHGPQRRVLLKALNRIVEEACNEEIRAGKDVPGLAMQVSRDCERVIATLLFAVDDVQARKLPGE